MRQHIGGDDYCVVAERLMMQLRRVEGFAGVDDDGRLGQWNLNWNAQHIDGFEALLRQIFALSRWAELDGLLGLNSVDAPGEQRGAVSVEMNGSCCPT